MWYCVDRVEVVSIDGLAYTIERAFKRNSTRIVLYVEPMTNKGKLSKRFEPFRVTVFNYPEWRGVMIPNENSITRKCFEAVTDSLTPKGIDVGYWH